MELSVSQSVQSLSCVRLFAMPWTAARQASLSITNSWSLLKLTTTESVMHPTISSSVNPFSSHLQSFLASGSFQMSQFFSSGGQSIGVSASALVLPDGLPQRTLPLGLTLKRKCLSSDPCPPVDGRKEESNTFPP